MEKILSLSLATDGPSRVGAESESSRAGKSRSTVSDTVGETKDPSDSARSRVLTLGAIRSKLSEVC